MDFTLTPKPVYTSVNTLSASSEQPVDLDFTLPDYCADVEKIFKCTVTPEVYSVSSGGGQLIVEGASLVRVLYCASDKKILRCAEQTIPFSSSFNLSTDSEDAVNSVKVKTEYVNCKAVSPRRLMIHGAVSVSVLVIARRTENLYFQCDSKELQTNLRNTTISELVSLQSETFTISESINTDSKSPVENILRSDAKVCLTDATAIGNRLMIKGEITLCMLYASVNANEPPQQFTYVFPVTHSMECPDADSADVREIDLNILSYDIKLKSDIVSVNPVVVFDAKLSALVSCRKESEVKYICDAYSTVCHTNLEYTPVTLENIVYPKTSIVMSKSAVSLGDIHLSRVIDIFCDSINIKPFVSQKLKLAGKANFCILGYDDNSELVYIERSVDIENEEPLSAAFTCGSDISSMIKSVSYRLSDGNTLELRAEIYVLTKLKKTENINIVSAVTDEGSVDFSEPSALTLYFAEEGESVWEIAKRYKTDKNALCAENNLSEDSLSEKMLLLIPGL